MGEEADFWKLASEPSDLWKLKVIAEGAKRFAAWLRGTQDWIRNVVLTGPVAILSVFDLRNMGYITF